MKKCTVVIIESDATLGQVYAEGLRAVGVDSIYASDFASGSYLLDQGGMEGILVDGSAHSSHLAPLTEHLSKLPETTRPTLIATSDIPYPEVLVNLALNRLVKPLTRPIIIGDLAQAIKMQASRQVLRIDYRAGIHDALALATRQVLGAYVPQQGIQIDRPVTKDLAFPMGHVWAFCSFSGKQILGSLALSFDRDFAVNLARHVLKEPDLQETEHETIADLTAEMCNQISGKARNLMIEHGLEVEISIPKRFSQVKTPFFHPGENEIGLLKFYMGKKGLWEILKQPPKGHIEYCFNAI